MNNEQYMRQLYPKPPTEAEKALVTKILSELVKQLHHITDTINASNKDDDDSDVPVIGLWGAGDDIHKYRVCYGRISSDEDKLSLVAAVRVGVKEADADIALISFPAYARELPLDADPDNWENFPRVERVFIHAETKHGAIAHCQLSVDRSDGYKVGDIENIGYGSEMLRSAMCDFFDRYKYTQPTMQ